MNTNEISRRKFLQTVGAGSMISLNPGILRGESVSSDPVVLNRPLAQDYVVAFRVPDKKHAIFGLAMVILPDGKYVAALEIKDYSKNTFYVAVLLSQDKGKTWDKVCEKPWASAHFFLYDNQLYMLTRPESRGVWVTVSSDEGRNWTEPVEVIKGLSAASHGGVVVRDGWLYCAITNFKAMGAIACNLGKGLLNPEAWIQSNLAEMPIPDALVSGAESAGKPWLAWTEKASVAEIGDIGDLMTLSAQLNNSNATSENIRMALKVGDNWYVSNDVLNGTEWSTQFVDVWSSSWNKLTFIPETELAIGSPTTLPSTGPVQAVGIFSEGTTIGQKVRLRDVKVEAHFANENL